MDHAILSLIILGISMILFFTEIFPVPFTAMGILIAFILTGILEPMEAFSNLTDSSILLFTAMFIVGDALFITGVADRIGQFIIKYAKTEKRAILLIYLAVGIASAFLSNTGTTAIFIPIVIGISKYDGYSRSRLFMPVCLAATVGGTLSLLGTTSNIVANSALLNAGYEGLGIFEFTPIALPVFIAGLLYFVFFGYRFLSEKDTRQLSESESAKYERELDHSSIPSWKRIASVVVLVFTILGMVFADTIGTPFYVIAWVGALILIYLGVISGAEAIDAMDWNTVLLIAGTLSIGMALDKTGAGSLIADTVVSIVGTSPIVVLAAIMMVTAVLSNFMSNTAAAALMAPIGLSLAETIPNMDARMLIMAIAISASFSYATPFGSTPNTMIYGLGGYKFSDYTKVGLPQIIISFAVTIAMLIIVY